MSRQPARALVEWIRASIKSLAVHPEYGTYDSVYVELASLSGLSKSMVTKLHSGEAMNPTADAIDALYGAVKAALTKLAA